MTPAYYQFPTCQVSDISLHLTPAAAQAVQCLARSSRLDGRNKSDRVDGRIEDLRKAQTFIEMEIDRPAADLPDPADVKPGEAWIVDTERYGRAVAFRSEDGQGSPWKFASKISTGRLLDCAITLVSRLMPAPRQITTRGELNALPEGTVVRAKGELVCERYRHRSKGLVWISTGVDEDFPVDRPVLPATVLWTPEVEA